MPSFDIVSEVDSNEIRHAVENANRELATRYDFRGIEAIFSLQDDIVTLTAQADMQCQQMLDILRRCLSKRSVDANALKVDTDALRSGKSFAIKVSFKQGIESAMAKKITTLIKNNKMKVQAQIQGEQVRITGKKRDDLQEVMALIKSSELGQPFQFNNFRN